jgi:molybdenum cofactor biosynthesis enzyme
MDMMDIDLLQMTNEELEGWLNLIFTLLTMWAMLKIYEKKTKEDDKEE